MKHKIKMKRKHLFILIFIFYSSWAFGRCGMAVVDHLICHIGNFKIINLNGIVNIGMTLNKHGESSGDYIVFGDEKFPIAENAQMSKVPMITNGLNPVNHEY